MRIIHMTFTFTRIARVLNYISPLPLSAAKIKELKRRREFSLLHRQVKMRRALAAQVLPHLMH